MVIPLGDRVLVRPLDAKETFDGGTIITPDVAKERLVRASCSRSAQDATPN